ncbi:MAG: phosphoethanolamine--lipid A transferase, partial [Luteimonas sp.]
MNANAAAQPRWKGRFAHPELSVETLTLAVCLFFSLFSNIPFWRAVAATGVLHGPSGWLTAACLFVAITALHFVLLCALLTRWTAKPILTIVLLVTAVAAHFMSQYTVYFDADMIRNVLHTDGKESRELISPGLILPLLLAGVVPACAVWWVRLRRRSFGRALWIRVVWLIVALAIAAGAMMLSFQSISGLIRNHKDVRHLITPGSYLASLAGVLFEAESNKDLPRIAVGAHAMVVGRPAAAKPRLLVLVIGETVRAHNWGLNGYARQTTPQLQRIDPINFVDVTSCGTSTEVSVPCMFSPYGRAHYDKKKIERSESFLHALERAGIATMWRDNQAGCKDVCTGLAFESYEHASDPANCNAVGCLDGVMLNGLMDSVGRKPGDQVVVLHQLGNHGPSYYKRYPARLRRFMPACESAELGNCSRAEIVNAYDNAVLQTDDFLARTIELLSSQSSRDTALIYVSDHGESLGENGLFLHGVPYAIAPDMQTKVPMVMWLSPGMLASRGIDAACLRREAKAPASHDNLFHSVLGLMQVQTPEY